MYWLAQLGEQGGGYFGQKELQFSAQALVQGLFGIGPAGCQADNGGNAFQLKGGFSRHGYQSQYEGQDRDFAWYALQESTLAGQRFEFGVL